MSNALHLSKKVFSKDIDQVPTRNGYGEGLLALGETNQNVVVLTGDLADSTRVLPFWKKYPERFIECGVAEQNMMGIAAGLAAAGKIPFVSSYAVFVPGRCWDQLRVSVCYSNLPVKVAGAHAGISVGPDGATHQALEDVAIVRAIPNITVIVPCDAIEAKKVTMAVAATPGPVYFRFAREKTAVFTTEKTPFEIGKAEVFREGSDVTIIGCGPLLHKALVAAEILSGNTTLAKNYQLPITNYPALNVEVINCHTIKPIDAKTLAASAKKTGAVVTVEEHQIVGGLGGAVAEVLAQHAPVPMEFVGMPNSFGESGQPDELLEKYGMGVKDILAAVGRVLRRKK